MSMQAGQAQHLAEWVETRKPKRLSLKTIKQQAGQLFDDLFLNDTYKSKALERGYIGIVLALLVFNIINQIGKLKGWW